MPGRTSPSSDPKVSPARVRGAGSRLAKAVEVARELRGLRGAFKESLERFALKVDGLLVEWIRLLEREKASGESRIVVPHVKTSNALLKKIRALKLKPGKGRFKDIEAVAELVGDVTDRMPKQP